MTTPSDYLIKLECNFFMFVFLSVFLLLVGVFGDEVKSVSVMEGRSVTLHVNDTDIQRDDVIQRADVIQWRFGPQKSLIAKINRSAYKMTIHDDVLDGRFRDRLQVDHQTGSLTIKNTKTTDSGLYQVEIISMTETSYRFNINVHGVIYIPKVVICCAVVGSLMTVTAILMFCICRKLTNTQQQVQRGGGEITYTDTICERQTHQPRAAVEDDVVYASVNKRH